MNRLRNNLGKSMVYNIIAFIALWYFYFSSSFTLRPFPQLFWICLAVISILSAIIHHYKLKKIDVYFLGGMMILVLFSIFSTDTFGSILITFNYVIYYLVARMISVNCSSKTIFKILMFFSIVHLICVYIQILVPGIYLSHILPLLPQGVHNEIMEQMKYNFAYYGFTVQTGMIAMYLSIGTILSMVRICESKNKKNKIIFMIIMILFLIATFFTVRRGSTVVTIVIITLIYYNLKGNALSKIFVGISVVLLISLVGLENIPGLSGILNKFDSLVASGSIMNGRDSLFSNAIASLSMKPLFGYGIGQIETAMGYSWLENSYLLILVECGVIGAIVFFIPYINIFKNTIRRCRNFKKEKMFFTFSVYIQIQYVLMSVIENYLAAPINVFLFFLIVFVGEKNYYEEESSKIESYMRRR